MIQRVFGVTATNGFIRDPHVAGMHSYTTVRADARVPDLNLPQRGVVYVWATEWGATSAPS